MTVSVRCRWPLSSEYCTQYRDLTVGVASTVQLCSGEEVGSTGKALKHRRSAHFGCSGPTVQRALLSSIKSCVWALRVRVNSSPRSSADALADAGGGAHLSGVRSHTVNTKVKRKPGRGILVRYTYV